MFIFKRGDTLILPATWTPGTDGPATLAGLTITAAIRTKLGERHILTVGAVVSPYLSCTATSTGDTGGWDLGPCQADFKMVNGDGVIVHTEDFNGMINERQAL